MSDDRYNILLGFSRGVKTILGKNLRKVILYGSYATIMIIQMLILWF